MRVLGISAVFHDPAATLVVDGRVVAAAEQELEGQDPFVMRRDAQ
ncbi:hypothetical protein [Mycolicibacter engbaekii]|nr:hypothetical protein [Mycolicibacter engbaekii]